MSPAGISQELSKELLDELAALEDAGQRRRFFKKNPDLHSTPVVERLCAEVSRLLWVEVERANRLAAVARWLAEDLGDAVSFGRSLRITANALHCSGETEKAQDFYQVALDRFSSLGEASEAAITRSSALLNLAYLGAYDTAFEWEKAARETFEQLGDRSRLAILEHNLANILSRQDRWEKALDHYRLAYEEFLKLERSQDAAICLRNMAVCHISLHNFAEALAVYETNRAFCEKAGLKRLVLEVDYNIAYLYYLRGEYTRAIRLFRITRRMCAAEGDEYHKALCDLDQAELLLELNMVEESAELARSAFTSFEQQKRPYETAKALTNQAIAVGRQGHGESALELLLQAREIFEHEKNQLWPALIDLYSAVVLYREQKPAEAIVLARGARRVFAESGVASRATLCDLLLAELLLATGVPEAARTACEEALARLRDRDLPALEHQAYLVLGQVEEAAGNHRAALDAYRESHRWLETLRSQLQGEDLKIAFLEDKSIVYESLVWLTLNGEAAESRKELIFDYIEKAKSRSLADLLAVRAHELPPRAPQHGTLADQVRTLREDLNWFYRQIDLQQMEGSEHSREEVRKLRQVSRRREDELQHAMRELQATDCELSSLQSGFLVSLETFREALPEGTALLEYYIARGTVFVAIVDPEVLEIRSLTSASSARKLHRLLQLQLSKLRLGIDRSAAELDLAELAARSHLQELYNELVAPIREHLKHRHLIIAPHSFLHYLPFHALLDGDRYLIDDFSISYAPSAGVSHLCAVKETHCEDHSLVLGVADERAPHILEEVEAVADCLPEARLLVAEAASEKALQELGGNSRFIHIATHGLFRRDNPLFSAIQLGASRLSLFDLYNLRLNAELVVLSGCGTGLSAVLGGDELVGLTRGLLYAGAQSALVTLWDVNDASTAAFMRRFYYHLGRQARLAQQADLSKSGGSGSDFGSSVGIHRAVAVQKTMQELRESYPSPYYWAPFILVGKPGES